MPSRETWSKMVLMASTVLMSYTISAALFALYHYYTTPADSLVHHWELSCLRFLLIMGLTGTLGLIGGLSPNTYDCRQPVFLFMLVASILSVCLNMQLTYQGTESIRRCADIIPVPSSTTSDAAPTDSSHKVLQVCDAYVRKRFAMLVLGSIIGFLSIHSWTFGIQRNRNAERLEPLVVGEPRFNDADVVDETLKAHTSKTEIAVFV